MCYENCFMLYEPGVNLRDLTCPCNRGFWDCFDEAFVTGDQIRRGQGPRPSREAYEAKVKAQFTPQEYEAKLREQFIIHFLKCEFKKERDEVNPANDGSTARRAKAELKEIRAGDFTSRGRTAAGSTLKPNPRSESIDQRLTSDVQKNVADFMPFSSSKNSEIPAKAAKSTRDVARDHLKQILKSQKRSVTSEQLEQLVSDYLDRQADARGNEVDTSSSKTRRKPTLITQFVPEEDIELGTLQQWLKENIGSGSTVRNYTHQREGKRREGYLIEAERALDIDMIAEIKKLSRIAARNKQEKSSALPPDPSIVRPRNDRHDSSRRLDTPRDLVSALGQMNLVPARARRSTREEDSDKSDDSYNYLYTSRQPQRSRDDRYRSESRRGDRQTSRRAEEITQPASRISVNILAQQTPPNNLIPSRHAPSDRRESSHLYTSDSRPRIIRPSRNETDSDDSDDDDDQPSRPTNTRRDSRAEQNSRETKPEPPRHDKNKDGPKERRYHR